MSILLEFNLDHFFFFLGLFSPCLAYTFYSAFGSTFGSALISDLTSGFTSTLFFSGFTSTFTSAAGGESALI